ncbi:unnamed protein product [Porites lobata]|uniref:Uncharacterized protein n=1 Tax=Porites lobata TaxID=104759 RepID=A0ABN8RU73_9CNID|nr:unnamed protein product [Porites lobata]
MQQRHRNYPRFLEVCQDVLSKCQPHHCPLFRFTRRIRHKCWRSFYIPYKKERLQQLSIQVNDLATGTEQEAYELMLAMKNALTQDGLEECAFEVENVGRIKFINAFQRVIDHVIIRTSGFPLNELGTSYVTLDGLSCLQRTTKLMDDFSIGPNANKEMVYLREMNGASLMLEIAERLELSEDLFLEDNIDQASASSLDVIELLSSYECLADGREIYLACEPRPFNYRLVDGGPDQKQSNLATKIAAAIEFRMELNAHACIQRRAERDSVANEAEREIQCWVVLLQ